MRQGLTLRRTRGNIWLLISVYLQSYELIRLKLSSYFVEVVEIVEVELMRPRAGVDTLPLQIQGPVDRINKD